QAQHIDLSGTVELPDVGRLSLTSSGDVQLLGLAGVDFGLEGALTLAGDLTINAARIFPATQMAYTITALGAGNSVTIGQTKASPGIPLSAGGSLTISADQIDSTGTLLAPFGAITLAATTSLNLGTGSVTSVSGGGAIIPYGMTQLGGQQWIYAGNNLPLD